MSASSPKMLDNDLSSLLSPTTTTTTHGIGGVVDEAEGIWSADIEQSFLEALAIYPPCGRRKIILTEEGKMYGRNELVARYIKIRTGKTRSRKQVSSHLQVLAKRRSKEIQSLRNNKEAQQVILDRLKRYTSAEIVSMDINENLKEKSLSSSADEDDSDPIDDDHDEESSSILKSKTKSCSSSPPSLPAVKSTKSRLGKKTTTSSPIKNLLHPLKVEEHPVKLIEESFPSIVHNVIPSMMPSQILSPVMPEIKPPATKRLASIDKSTGFAPPPMITNSVPYILPTSPVIYPNDTSRSRCSSNASSSSPLSSGSGSMTTTTTIPSPATIGDENFRLHELSVFVEIKRTNGTTTHPSLIYPYSETCSLYQHDILRLHAADIHFKNLHIFETISIDQIFDKFPRHDGLKDLFERNPDGPFFLIKFWANVPVMSSIMNATMAKEETFFTSYTFASCLNRPIHVSTRLCSFGKQVLEKVETSEHPQRDPFDQCIYRFDRSPLCDYMVQFIQKLRSLPNPCMMNSVLENFTVLQVIKCRDDPQRLLLCIAFVFEIATFDAGGPQYHVYKLVAS